MKKKYTYDYKIEFDDEIIIQPIFFTALHHVQEQLSHLPDADEYLEVIETEKVYKSQKLPIDANYFFREGAPNMTRIEPSFRCISLDQEVLMNKLFLEVMRIMPRYTRYMFYRSVENVQAYSGNDKRTKLSFNSPLYGNKRLSPGRRISRIQQIHPEENLQRTPNFNVNEIKIDLYLLYANLGEVISSTEFHGKHPTIESYLENLKRIINSLENNLGGRNLNDQMLNNQYKRMSNESRAALCDFSKDKHYSLLEGEAIEIFDTYSNTKHEDTFLSNNFPWKTPNSLVFRSTFNGQDKNIHDIIEEVLSESIITPLESSANHFRDRTRFSILSRQIKLSSTAMKTYQQNKNHTINEYSNV